MRLLSPMFGSVALLASLLFQQTKDTWVLNLPGAPAILEAQKRGSYTLKNISKKKFVAFTLGCVDPSDEKPVVIHKFQATERPLNPEWSTSSAIADAPFTEEYAECVHIRKVKMAVIQVDFDDKTSWKAGLGEHLTADWTFNRRASPVLLTAENEANLRVANLSQEEIVSLTLGCIEKKDSGFSVLHQFSSERKAILPNQKASIDASDSSRSNPYDECVRKRKSQVAVVRVEFATGDAWDGSKERRAADLIFSTNRDDEPVFLEGQEPFSYSLESVSEQRIVSITLGCALKGHKPEILHRFPPLALSLEPGRIFYYSTKDGSAGQGECVSFRGTKLAVVQVNFGDGTDWNIN